MESEPDFGGTDEWLEKAGIASVMSCTRQPGTHVCSAQVKASPSAGQIRYFIKVPTANLKSAAVMEISLPLCEILQLIRIHGQNRHLTLSPNLPVLAF